MRLIDADELWSRLVPLQKEAYWKNNAWGKALKKCIGELENSPTIDAEIMKHGHWVKTNKGDYEWECSSCGFGLSDYRTTYCYDCGAKMDEDEWQEPEINPCSGCVDYDGRGGCKSNGGCGADMGEVEENETN